MHGPGLVDGALLTWQLQDKASQQILDSRVTWLGASTDNKNEPLDETFERLLT